MKRRFWLGFWNWVPKRKKIPRAVELDPVARTFTLGTRPPRLIKGCMDMLPFLRDENAFLAQPGEYVPPALDAHGKPIKDVRCFFHKFYFQ